MNEDLKTFELVILRFLRISSWTLGVAVAVSAIMVMLESIESIISLIFLYSGLKSCPHSDMQCASSIAKNDIEIFFKNSIVSFFDKVSGAINSNFVLFSLISVFTLWISSLLRVEFKTWATELS